MSESRNFVFPTNGNVFICTNLETRLESQNSVDTRDGVRFKWVNRRRFLSSVRFECKLNSQFHCPMYTSLLVHQTDRGKDSCDNFRLSSLTFRFFNLEPLLVPSFQVLLKKNHKTFWTAPKRPTHKPRVCRFNQSSDTFTTSL